MTTFSGRNSSAATLESPIDAVWAVLTDPAMVARLTPYLDRIDVDGDRWVWHMSGIPVMNRSIAPSFTEIMAFDEPERIEYHHDPARTKEWAGAEGVYHLASTPEGGTHVAIDIVVTVDLPAPRMMRPVVERSMDLVMAGIGRGFADRLLRHLGEH